MSINFRSSFVSARARTSHSLFYHFRFLSFHFASLFQPSNPPYSLRAMTTGVSPSSSPRLPSPPPFTEVQIGPQSPSLGENFGKDGEQLLGAAAGEDDGSTRRIRPGTKAADMAFGPPLIPLSQVCTNLSRFYRAYTDNPSLIHLSSSRNISKLCTTTSPNPKDLILLSRLPARSQFSSLIPRRVSTGRYGFTSYAASSL